MPRMNAKTRYRQRLKMQAALTRVLQVLFHNTEHGIRPDRTTAKMAAEVIRRLFLFCGAAGMAVLDDWPDDALARSLCLIQSRWKETHARYRRRASGRRYAPRH